MGGRADPTFRKTLNKHDICTNTANSEYLPLLISVFICSDSFPVGVFTAAMVAGFHQILESFLALSAWNLCRDLVGDCLQDTAKPGP